MRKATRFFRFLSIALLTAAVAACSDSDNDNPTTPPGGDGGSGGGSEVVPTEGVTTEAFYKGDLYGTGSGNLWINFISEMEYDDFEEDYIGPGYILCLDFNTTLAQNADFATLAEGTYTCDYASDSHETFTLNVALGDSYLVRYAEGGGSESFDITGGTVTVAIREDYYCIDAALTLSDNSEYSYSFVGKLSFLNRSNEGQMSNLTGDVALSGMTQAMAAYYGASFTDTSDFYTVIIAGPDYDLDINYGTSDALMLTLNVTPGSPEGIPSGSYTVADTSTAEDFYPNTALSGIYDPTYGGYFGTWFFSTTGKLEASLRGGKVEVTNNGDGTCRVDIDLEDGYGHRVTGSCTVPCRVEDWS